MERSERDRRGIWGGAGGGEGRGRAGAQFERVASVGGFNEVSCNYMH